MGLHAPSLDADLSIPALLADQLGFTLMKRATARTAASKTNGRRHTGNGQRRRKTGNPSATPYLQSGNEPADAPWPTSRDGPLSWRQPRR